LGLYRLPMVRLPPFLRKGTRGDGDSLTLRNPAVEREYEYFYESPAGGIHSGILNNIKLWRRTLFCGVIIASTSSH
jgi:hypothetical protein